MGTEVTSAVDTYEAFENKCGLSASSPEAYYAESAWNHALKEALDLIMKCSKTESTAAGLAAMLDVEINSINTDFYGT